MSTAVAEPVESERGQLLTAEDVARRWQVPTSHVYRLAREGGLPVVQLGRYRRFSLVAIKEFEEAGGTVARTANRDVSVSDTVKRIRKEA
jgi:excisionase family DNA binding protein